MNYSDYKFTLDVQIHQAQVSVPVSLGDTARRLCIGLTDGRKPYTIEDGCIASFVAKKPDGKVLHNNCIIERNTIVYEFTDQTTNVEGVVNCEIRLQKGGVLLVSPQFLIVVDKQVVRDDEVAVSTDQINSITAIIAEETMRQQNEAARLTWEILRDQAENGYEGADGVYVNGRVQNEADRVAEEIERRSFESTRRAHEIYRSKAENGYYAEGGEFVPGRVQNEEERIKAENERIANEEARQKTIRDVGTALDGVIALQNSLINKGGN